MLENDYGNARAHQHGESDEGSEDGLVVLVEGEQFDEVHRPELSACFFDEVSQEEWLLWLW
jgi:hypothetical protein